MKKMFLQMRKVLSITLLVAVIFGIMPSKAVLAAADGNVVVTLTMDALADERPVTLYGYAGDRLVEFGDSKYTVKIQGDFKSDKISGLPCDWIKNLPEGLKQEWGNSNDHEILIEITGVPLERSYQNMEIVIPKDAFLSEMSEDLKLDGSKTPKMEIGPEVEVLGEDIVLYRDKPIEKEVFFEVKLSQIGFDGEKVREGIDFRNWFEMGDIKGITVKVKEVKKEGPVIFSVLFQIEGIPSVEGTANSFVIVPKIPMEMVKGPFLNEEELYSIDPAKNTKIILLSESGRPEDAGEKDVPQENKQDDQIVIQSPAEGNAAQQGAPQESQKETNGWYMENGERYWFDHGVMARDKEVYDPQTDAWYWFDEDGTMARDKDVFVPTNAERTEGKWVRYDADGGMVKGEEFRYGGWYWFDPVTGEMIKDFVFIPEEGTEGKWVYYDQINGQMHHGESCIDGNWYYFDEWTGKMTHGECYRNNAWYYYDQITGIMAHGWTELPDGTSAFYDDVSGMRR